MILSVSLITDLLFMICGNMSIVLFLAGVNGMERRTPTTPKPMAESVRHPRLCIAPTTGMT